MFRNFKTHCSIDILNYLMNVFKWPVFICIPSSLFKIHVTDNKIKGTDKTSAHDCYVQKIKCSKIDENRLSD